MCVYIFCNLHVVECMLFAIENTKAMQFYHCNPMMGFMNHLGMFTWIIKTKKIKTKESTFLLFIIMHNRTWYWLTFFCTLLFYNAWFDKCSNIPFTINWVLSSIWHCSYFFGEESKKYANQQHKITYMLTSKY